MMENLMLNLALTILMATIKNQKRVDQLREQLTEVRDAITEALAQPTTTS
jgi:hypothetical protein